MIDHQRPLKEGIEAIGTPGVDCVLIGSDMDAYWPQLAGIVRPQGSICPIVRNEKPAGILAIRRKSLRFAREGMFTRSSFQTPDMIGQHRLLCRVADWIDAGRVRCTLTGWLSPINAANLRATLARLESKAMIGRLALAGWRRAAVEETV